MSTRIKVHVRLKSNGKEIKLNAIKFKKLKTEELLKDRTVGLYCTLLETLNSKLSKTYLYKPEPRTFYWERFCEDRVIDEIIKNLHSIYTITSGHDLVMRIAPIITCLYNVPNIPADFFAKWVSLKQQYSNDDNYLQLCDKLNIILATKVKVEKDIIEWTDLVEKLSKISISKTDPRFRVLASIYKYGYVLRIGSIYLTNFKQQSESYNHLDLDSGIWTINHGKVRVQSFSVPRELCIELKSIVTEFPDLFQEGWILPKKNGKMYGKNSGISQLTPWITHKLPNCIDCRKSFETWHWYNSGCDLEKVEQMSTILDHTKTTAIVHYTPPY
jgi:hypothetical protein